MPKSGLSIIIPTYNEREIISDSLIGILKGLDKLDIDAGVIVIDNSNDGTEEILYRISKSYKNLEIVHNDKPHGIGYAVRKGIALSKTRFGIILMADSPDDVKYVPLILDRLQNNYDFVFASRFMKNSNLKNYPLAKLIANRLTNNIARIAFARTDLRDLTNLFKGFSIDGIKSLNLESSQFDIGLEIALKAIRKGYKIAEVPVNWKEREAGKSKLMLSKQGLNYIKRMLKVFFTYW